MAAGREFRPYHITHEGRGFRAFQIANPARAHLSVFDLVQFVGFGFGLHLFGKPMHKCTPTNEHLGSQGRRGDSHGLIRDSAPCHSSGTHAICIEVTVCNTLSLLWVYLTYTMYPKASIRSPMAIQSTHCRSRSPEASEASEASEGPHAVFVLRSYPRCNARLDSTKPSDIVLHLS